MLTEIDCLNRCKKDIESLLQIGACTSWSLRDYEHLSDKIFTRTGVQLSVSTLKRLWIYKTDTIPNISTLDALARFAGAGDWYEYKERIAAETPEAVVKEAELLQKTGEDVEPVQKRSQNVQPADEVVVAGKRSFLTRISVPKRVLYLLILLLLLLAAFLFLRKPSYTFYLRNDQLCGVPNTVEFVYDISKSGAAYGFVQQDWDPARRVRISSSEKSLFNTYHFPGYFEASLVVNNEIVRKIPVFIKTKGWVPVVLLERFQVKPTYLPVSAITPVNLHVKPSDVAAAGVDTDKPYFTNFFNVRDFGPVTCDNATLISEIKNDPAEGGAQNLYAEIILKFQDGRILIPFSKKGATSTLDVEFGESYLDGSENDFSCFGVDLTQWKNVKLLVKNRHVYVFLEGLKIFDVVFEKNMGKLVGIQYCFGGCGSVRKSELYDADGQLVFSDGFGNR